MRGESEEMQMEEVCCLIKNGLRMNWLKEGKLF